MPYFEPEYAPLVNQSKFKGYQEENIVNQIFLKKSELCLENFSKALIYHRLSPKLAWKTEIESVTWLEALI